MKPLPVIAFLITAAIGWEIGGNSAPPAKPAETSMVTEFVSEARPTHRSRKAPGPEGEAGQLLAAIRASRDPSARMHATINLASTLPVSEFAAWMDGGWFDLRDGVELTLFTKILQERWKNEDPEGFIIWTQKSNPQSAFVFLQSLAQTDPQRLIEFYQKHPDPANEINLLSMIAQTNPALALKRLLEISASNSSLITSLSNYVFTPLAEKSPAALEAALDSLTEPVRSHAEAALIRVKMRTSFDEEFTKLLGRSDGGILLADILQQSSSDTIRPIEEKLLADPAGLPSSWRSKISSNRYYLISTENAGRWITADLEGSGFTSEEAKTLRDAALGQLESKPEIALKLMAQMNADDNTRHNLISNIFGRLRNTPDKAESLMVLLTTEADRAFAVSLSAPATESGSANIYTPAGWLAGLATLDPKNVFNRFQFDLPIQSMDATQQAAVFAQFTALPADTKRKVAENLLRTNLAVGSSALEGDAIRFLINDPTPETPENLNTQRASNYIAKLANTDPTGASEWIQTLPAGDAKLWAQKNLNSLWSQYDPKAAAEWMKTLPTGTQNQIENLKH